MNIINKFEKVSYDEFKRAFTIDITESDEETIKQCYDEIKLPERATMGSAGYDFYVPYGFSLEAGETAVIPTGIRVKLKDNRLLAIFPRSGLGFKYRVRLDNTVGIIDSDYYYSDNEGHIMVKITNESLDDKVLDIQRGDKFVQGIILSYDTTVDDDNGDKKKRNGGFGSTDEI